MLIVPQSSITTTHDATLTAFSRAGTAGVTACYQLPIVSNCGLSSVVSGQWSLFTHTPYKPRTLPTDLHLMKQESEEMEYSVYK